MSGQSNAAMTLGMVGSGSGELAANATAEMAGSAEHGGLIRLFNTGVIKATVPAPDILAPDLGWSRASPAALGGVSVMGDAPFSASKDLDACSGLVVQTRPLPKLRNCH